MRAGALSPDSTRGRQEQARHNDRAVLAAAREVFGTHGPTASIGLVAERAGVGVGTLYRRYGSKTELVRQLCVLATDEMARAARTGLDAADPWVGLAEFTRTCVQRRAGALATLAGHIENTAEMEQHAETLFGLVDRLVKRAHADRSLRADATTTDLLWLIEHLGRRPVDDHEAESALPRLVAICLDGLHTGPDGKLPTPAPRKADYRRRWRTPPSDAGDRLSRPSPRPGP